MNLPDTANNITVCLATNIAFAFSKWIRDQVVELFQDCASSYSYYLIKLQFYFCGKTVLPLIY